MFDDKIFITKCTVIDGIYDCLNKETQENRIKKVEIATYSERADEFDEKKMLNLTLEHQEILMPLMNLPKGSTILEIGGGDGRFAFYLMKNGYTVIESDIALGSVQKTKSIADKHNILNGVFAIIDAENLPFKDESLDGIFMVASLHHLPYPEKAIVEFNRCLKNNGYLLILREPASWQYKLFGPIFWIIRMIARNKNKNLFSLADDETRGFSIKQLKQLLFNFSNIELKPTSYLYKCYYNFLLLLKKFSGKPIKENIKIKTFLKKLDNFIKKLPIIKNCCWDWDIYCRKKG
ncbi:MAG: class I SAM-dependent methyltransferase [Patescibacteria group bacterium]